MSHNIAMIHVVQRIANETEVRVKTCPGGPGYIYILPVAKLSSKTPPLRKRNFDPIAAAEVHLKRVSAGFSHWLRELDVDLKTAHEKFLLQPMNPENFDALRACIHEIKGNAPVLGCDAAGDLAAPMATAMERCTDHKTVRATFDLVISAIGSALRGEITRDDDQLVELISMLDDLNARCAISRTQPPKNQAAGKARSAS